jgi:hypothetical protein
MQPNESFPFSQKPATYHYSKHFQSSMYYHAQIIKD